MMIVKLFLIVSYLGIGQCWIFSCVYPFRNCKSSTSSSGNTTYSSNTTPTSEPDHGNLSSIATFETTQITELDSGSGSDQTPSTTTSTMKKIDSIENINEATAILNNLNAKGLTSPEKNVAILNILKSVEGVFDVGLNDDGNYLQTWINMFDAMKEYVSDFNEETIETFLQTSINTLVEIAEQDKSFEGIRNVALRIEDYAVTTTKYIIEVQENTEEFVAIHSAGADVFACKSDSDNCIVKSELYEFDKVITDMIYVTYVIHNKSEEINTSSVGSQIVSVTAHDGDGTTESGPIQFILKHFDSYPIDYVPECGFLDEQTTSGWSTEGCRVVSSNTSHTKCHCDHMTNFAILFLHSDIEISDEENLWFNIITYVGCGISITALLVTMATFGALGLYRSERVILLWHLSFCLCSAQLVLVAGTNVVVGTIECKLIAILMHFFFMASFSWMLVEGCQLYCKAVRAMKGGYNFKVLIVAGWVIPVVIVCATIGAGLDGYGTGRGCWISLDNGLVWAFIGPAVGCIVINCVLLTFVMKVFLGLKSVLKSNEIEKTKRAAKALACLMPLLGITWIFGLFAVDESTKWFLYVFCICNSLQGMGIFVLHCARNDEVRKAFLKKYRRSFMSIGTNSISNSNSQKSGETYLSNRSTSEFPSSLPKVVKW